MTPHSWPQQQNWLQLPETWEVEVSPSESYHCLRWWQLRGFKGGGGVSLACRLAGIPYMLDKD